MPDMETNMPVTGIGGFFFRSKDPESLRAWYAKHLGIIGEGWSGWQQQAGVTFVEPFKHDTDYFAADKSYLLNLRVTGLTTKDEWNTAETGRFARIHDPEGNPVELWEPPAA
jgi:glyoxylase I family protein